MDQKPPDLNTNEIQRPIRTIEELERMLEIIDAEIVRSGADIPQKRLEELVLQKGKLTKEIAKLKGENRDKKLIDEY